MKKSLVQLLASMVLVSLSFCASAATTLEFLEVMTSPERTQLLKSMIAEYEELNPEIKINLISPPYEQSEQKATLMRVSQRLSGQGLSPMLMLEVY